MCTLLAPPFQALRHASRVLEHAHALFPTPYVSKSLRPSFSVDWAAACYQSSHFTTLCFSLTDNKIYESLVVNEYLAEKFPPGGEHDASPLLPASPADKAKVRIVTSRSNDLVTAYFTYLSNKDEVR